LLMTLAGDVPAGSSVIESTRQAQVMAAFRAVEQVSRLTDQLIAGEIAASLQQTARALLTELTRLDAILATLEKN
jgi:N-acyl-L-homoserine lactone synthetase